MDNVVTIIVAIIGSGVLNTIINQIIASKTKQWDDKEHVKQAIRLIMKREIKKLCEEYIKQGWIYADELDDLIAMHKCYHDELNGNGFLDELMNRVRQLEIKGVK